MTLELGTRLGHYVIAEPLGKGGMGEVYRARDEILGRDVAIKVLPEEVAKESERLARFKREAQLLASLNHTNIAAIHGLEVADGKPFLVLELVEGEDLSERLKCGPIPADDAIEIAKQIAEALEEAHEKGIVHRDLKPANVKLAPDGKVKILDFGLAKAYAGEPASRSSADLSQSPTIAHMGTQAGVILGTAAYMSPEQARGKAVDKRADIWAFGVVLFEMLTGKQLFTGETVGDLLAAVLTGDPEWASLPQSVPTSLQRLLRRCLERDPRRRLRDIFDARLDLEEQDPPIGAGSATDARRYPGWLAITALAVGVAIGGTLFGTWIWRGRPLPERNEPLRFEIGLPENTALIGGISLSPDGRALAFALRDDRGQTSLWMRSMNELEPRRVEGTLGARFPFWSPDARQLGFFAGGELRVMDLIGQSSRTIAPTSGPGDVRGATWGANQVIVYAPNFTGALMKVSAVGGEPQPATRLDTGRRVGTHRLPSFLPDGRHYLFYASSGGGVEPGDVCLGEVGSTEYRRLTASHSSAVFLPPEWLIYTRGKALVAQRLDIDRGELLGEPAPLGVELPGNFANSGSRAVTAAGDFVAYQVGVDRSTRLVWVDRNGTERGTVFDGHGWLFGPRLSPDGRRTSVSAYGSGSGSIWVVDPARHNQIRMTFEDRRDDQLALWSPDGRELVLVSIAAETAAAYLMESGRPRSEHLLAPIAGLYSVDSWLPDGERLLYTRLDPDTRADIWSLERRAAAESKPLLVTPSNEHSPDVSPEGHWFAYVSDSSGREEVYVRRMDGDEEVWRISTEGGHSPLWRRDGRELFYVDAAVRLHAVTTTLGSTFSLGASKILFKANLEEGGGRQYDVTPDGQRFLLNQSTSEATQPIVVVRGWAGEIERLLAH